VFFTDVNRRIILGITVFFLLFPSSDIPNNTTFRKLDLFPSSGEGGGRCLRYWEP
jgi:hypothetical protein